MQSLSSNPWDKSTNSHMEAVLSGDGPDHSTAWRGPRRGGMDSRLTDSLSGNSIRSTSIHACTLSPQRCGPPKDAEVKMRTQDTLDGWVSRGLTSPHQPPASVHSPFRCAPSPPCKLRNSQVWKTQILMAPSPSSFSNHLQTVAAASTIWQRITHLNWLCSDSDRSSGLPNPLLCCCAVAETYSWRLAHCISCW